MIIVQLREFRVIIRLKPLGNESAVLLSPFRTAFIEAGG